MINREINHHNHTNMDRPRRKSPLSINRLNDRDNIIQINKSRSKSPKIMTDDEMYRFVYCVIYSNVLTHFYMVISTEFHI